MAFGMETEREGRVVTVRLRNPPHGFMNREMVAGLRNLVDSLEGDAETGAVVITGGEPGKFVTHYDVTEIVAGAEALELEVGPRLAGATLGALAGLRRIRPLARALKRSPAAGTIELQEIHDLFLRMNRLDKVFVAAIGGPATGGGCELALACDIRLMARSVGRIGLFESTLDILPGAGGTQRLVRAVGTARALELMLEGTLMDAEEAAAAGIVNRAVDAEKLLPAATAQAARLTGLPPGTIRGIKRAVYLGGSAPLAAGLALERREFLAQASTPGAAATMRAYVDRVERDGAPPVTDPDAYARWLDRDGRDG